mmetsp:Transcript_10492/g.22098  ORF Transcript_10492/g.22098 Transcript_10492/m.22098 type:complete len:188 (-) Transcript_10492:1444-2007(-)
MFLLYGFGVLIAYLLLGVVADNLHLVGPHIAVRPTVVFWISSCFSSLKIEVDRNGGMITRSGPVICSVRRPQVLLGSKDFVKAYQTSLRSSRNVNSLEATRCNIGLEGAFGCTDRDIRIHITNHDGWCVGCTELVSLGQKRSTNTSVGVFVCRFVVLMRKVRVEKPKLAPTPVSLDDSESIERENPK